MSRGRILIVDDDIVVLRTLRDGLLAHGNIDVITATSANDALELLTLTQVDVVLTAADLGEADGAELIAEARRRQPSARGVVMLAAEHEEGRRRSVAAGASAFLGRPAQLAEVLELVERLLPAPPTSGSRLLGFNLIDLLQLVAMSRQDLRMTVQSEQGPATLHVVDGLVVHAEAPGQQGINAALVVLSLREADVVSAKFTLPREAWTLQVPVMELLMQAAQREDEAALERARLVVERSQAVLLERVPAAISAVLIDLLEDATLASAGPPTVAPRAAIDALRSLPTDGAVVPESVRIGYADGTSEFVFRLPNRRTVQWVRARSLRGVDTELQLAVSTSAAELEAALDLVHPVRTGNSSVARIVTGA